MPIVPFDLKGIGHNEFVPPNSTVNSDLLSRFETLERKYATKKTRTSAQIELAPS
jgi:hypothetical protein